MGCLLGAGYEHGQIDFFLGLCVSKSWFIFSIIYPRAIRHDNLQQFKFFRLSQSFLSYKILVDGDYFPN